MDTRDTRDTRGGLMPGRPREPEEFLVTLRAEPGWSVPVGVRLKRWLKACLRGYGLRCIDVRERKDGLAEDGEQKKEAA